MAGQEGAGRPPVVGFTPEVLDRSVLAIPLLRDLEDADPTSEDPDTGGRETEVPDAEHPDAEHPGRPPGNRLFGVVIDLNMTYRGGRERARSRARQVVAAAIEEHVAEGQGAAEG